MNQSDCRGPVAPESSTANMASITAADDAADDDTTRGDVFAVATAAAVSDMTPACISSLEPAGCAAPADDVEAAIVAAAAAAAVTAADMCKLATAVPRSSAK